MRAVQARPEEEKEEMDQEGSDVGGSTQGTHGGAATPEDWEQMSGTQRPGSVCSGCGRTATAPTFWSSTRCT